MAVNYDNITGDLYICGVIHIADFIEASLHAKAGESFLYVTNGLPMDVNYMPWGEVPQLKDHNALNELFIRMLNNGMNLNINDNQLTLGI